jgi:hypothetical protein
VFIVVSILGSRWLADAGIVGPLVAVVIGAFSLEHIINLFTWCGLRWWARSFLGEWFYFSDSQQQLRTGHFARVSFYVKASELHYQVRIYSRADIDGLLGEVPGSVASALGYASSISISYDGDETVQVLYDFTPSQGVGGLGILRLVGVRHGTEMSGEWVTARPGNQTSSGTSRWFRRDRFIQYLHGPGSSDPLADGGKTGS